MKILFLGAGGVGGYFGARLIQAGADVSFLVRPGRAEILAASGLRIKSPHGDFAVPAKCVTQDGVSPDYDLVILAPKAYDLESAIESVAPAVGPGTHVLPFLNGLAHMERLDRRFGPDHVLGGVAHIAAVLEGDGTVRQLTAMHSLTAGGRTPATQAVAERFIACCAPAKFDAFLSPDIVATLWEKWVFLASLAGITTLMRASVGEIVATRHGEGLTRQLYAECLAVASANAVEIPENAREKALRMLTLPGSPLTASMLRDLLAGQRTEYLHILGDLLDRGEARKVATPILKTAFCQMELRDRGSARQ